ncbi:hypothetical protein J6590_050202 [Homalodisca vitripennis]|nr:hypothetical protein J6590_050202 [Homalodisca vitripennis]
MECCRNCATVQGFSEESDIEKFLDYDEGVDPSFQMIPPRIDVFAETEGLNLPDDFLDAPLLEGEDDRVDVEGHILEPLESWEVNVNFNPLPPASPFEDLTDKPRLYSHVDIFKKYIPDELLEQIAESRRNDIYTKTSKVVSLTGTYISKFLGMTVMMLYLKYLRLKMYWAARTNHTQVADVMPRNTYFMIRDNLRCRDYGTVTNEEKQSNKYWKVASILNFVREEAELRGGSRGYSCQIALDGGQMVIVKWFDNKPVVLASCPRGLRYRGAYGYEDLEQKKVTSPSQLTDKTTQPHAVVACGRETMQVQASRLFFSEILDKMLNLQRFKPDRFDVEPSSPLAGQQWSYWKKTSNHTFSDVNTIDKMRLLPKLRSSKLIQHCCVRCLRI